MKDFYPHTGNRVAEPDYDHPWSPEFSFEDYASEYYTKGFFTMINDSGLEVQYWMLFKYIEYSSHIYANVYEIDEEAKSLYDREKISDSIGEDILYYLPLQGKESIINQEW